MTLTLDIFWFVSISCTSPYSFHSEQNLQLQPQESSKESFLWAIILGVVLGVLCIAAVLVGLFLLIRRRKASNVQHVELQLESIKVQPPEDMSLKELLQKFESVTSDE